MPQTGKVNQLIGRYYHALEQKGRISIPPSFRQELGTKGIITRGLDGCLFLFSLKYWDKLISEAGELPLTQKASRDWVRLMANHAQPIEFDRINRILIPDYLRNLAGLSKAVVIVGSLTHVEIWDQSTYHHYLEVINRDAETISERIYGFTHTSHVE